MKKKTIKKIIKTIIIIILILGVFLLGRKSGLKSDVSNMTVSVTEETVTKRTIKKELSNSGQIETATTEKIIPSTTKYFKTMCVEDDDTVQTGENILQYSDGTYLTATYNCVIISHSLPETGNKCTTSNYIEVKSLDNLVINISINENEINDIEETQEVTIVPTADTTKQYTGTITKINSVGTYQSSGTTYEATISFANDGTLKLGMSVSCTILLKEQENVLTVPINAVQTNNNQKYVIVVDENGTTKNVDIETGISDDEYVEVTTGLEEGQKVKVTTTTTQSTQRSNSNKEKTKDQNGPGEAPGGMDQGGMPGGFDKQQAEGQGAPSK